MSPKKLRVTPAMLYVLMSLADGPGHGYAILSEVESRSGGEASLGPSSLYYTLGRLSDEGLIAETTQTPETEDPHADQRRYFALTTEGRERLRSEIGVLTGIVEQARLLGLLSDGA